MPDVRPLVLAGLALVAPLAGQTRTPPQPFFAWTHPTFAPAEYAARRSALLERLRKSGGGVLLVPSAAGRSRGETFRQTADFLYLTGLELPDSVLALDADGDGDHVVLFVPGTDRRFEDPARRNDFPGRRLLRDPALAERSGIATLRARSQLDEQLAAWRDSDRLIRVDGGRRGALPDTATTAVRSWTAAENLLLHLRRTYPRLRLQNAFDDVAALRSVKSPAEIAVLRRACGITAAGIRATAAAVRDGVTERELEGVLEAEFKRRGAQRPAFASIVKSGPNSLWPWRILAAHYDRRNRAMHDGELVILDVGCELDHYASDVGRTLPVSGHFTPQQADVLRMVTAVSDAVIAAVHPGTTLAALQEVARQHIPDAARHCMQAAIYFGHHVGLEVGDPALAEVPLAPGMVFTVEPWYYDHERPLAVFVEDVVLVTENGAESLTAALPRTPAELERLVGARRPPPLRVLSYNVRHGAGMDGRVDLARVAAVIEAQRPDLVALQEIDDRAGRTGGIDQARRLGELCGMHAVFGPFMDFDGGRYGMALLSRHPIEATENVVLPEGAEPRAALAARVRLAGSERRLWFVGIHLYATEAQRLAQAQAVLDRFGGAELPVVLAGDFNSRPGTAVMTLLDRHWTALEKQGDRRTFPSPRPVREIDFVLLPDGGPLAGLECRVIDEPVASDHRPVLAVVGWRDPR